MFILLLSLAFGSYFKACIPLVNELHSVRFTVSDWISCINSNFLGLTSDELGGAIFVNQSDNILKIDSCLFLKCSSFGSTFFNRNCSGGAIWGNVLYSKILRSNFVECFAISAGSSIYISGDKSTASSFEDSSLTKAKCPRDSTGEVYMHDTASVSISRDNVSHSVTSSQAFFIGYHPLKLSIENVAVVGHNINRGIELSSNVAQADVSSILFLDMEASNAIFLMWSTSFTVSDIHVIKCTHDFALSKLNGSITVKNSWIGSGISVDESIVTLVGSYREDSSIEITKVIEYYSWFPFAWEFSFTVGKSDINVRIW